MRQSQKGQDQVREQGRMLRVGDVAKRLNLDPWSVYQMAARGVLPAHRIGPKGRSLRFAEADVVAYLATRRGLPRRPRRGRGAPGEGRSLSD